jgi:hypothetical protein
MAATTTIHTPAPGTHWTNTTGVPQYQFIAGLSGACSKCLPYHLRISAD